MDQRNGVSRRTLLKLSAAAGVVGAIPVGIQTAEGETGFAGQFGGNRSGVHYWTAEEFETHLNASFKVDAGLGRSIRMKLAEVEALPQDKNPAVTGHAFALHFQQTEGAPVNQGTFLFENATLGTHPLFVVPNSAVRGRYTAVINHRSAPSL